MDASLAPEIMTAIREKEQQLDARARAEGLVTLAKVSQRGRRRREAYEFLVGYLDHGREPVRLAAIRALGELHDPRARPLLVGVQERTTGGQAAAIAKAALAELDSAAPLAPEEVSQLRSEVRKLHATQEQLQKSLDELKAKLGAQADNETDKLRAKERP
jgi:HEAT repeat protein